MQHTASAFVALAILAVTAALSALLIVALKPWLAHYALAKPNARSSHKIPTPQGGGIAVVGATIAVSAILFFSTAARASATSPALLFCAVLLMAGIGVMADKHPISPALRLVLQIFAVAAALSALPSELRLLPVLPWWSERVLLAIAVLWFVNLVNFMDGLDWMTVAETVPARRGARRLRPSWHPAVAGNRYQSRVVWRHTWLRFF